MSYRFEYVFCATHQPQEDERLEFHKILGEINESHAMSKGILLGALSLPLTMGDKRVYQRVVDENIRTSRWYVLVLEDTWGPPERNLEHDYQLALECLQEPDLPMQRVAVLFKRPSPDKPVQPEIGE